MIYYSLQFFRAVCRFLQSHSLFKLAVKFNKSFDSFKWQFTYNIPENNIHFFSSDPLTVNGSVKSSSAHLLAGHLSSTFAIYGQTNMQIAPLFRQIYERGAS